MVIIKRILQSLRWSLLLLLACASLAQAGVIKLEPARDSYLVHKVVDVMEDPGGQLNFADVSKDASNIAFREYHTGVFSFGFTDSAYWFRFEVDNPSTDVRNMMLVLRTAWLDDISVYTPEGEGSYRGIQLGDSLPFVQRLHPNPQFLVDLQVQPGKQTYYLRIRSTQALLSPIELWDAQAFYDNDRLLLGYFGMFYGVVLVMLLYNAFIWGSTRDRSYLYYCLYLAAFFIMNFSYNGFSFQYLWPELPRWANLTYTSWVFLYQLMAIIFAMVFLETAKRLPRMHRVLCLFLYAMVAAWLFTLIFADPVLHNATGVYFVFLYSPLTAIAGFLAWRAGFPAARFFVVASMGNLVGAFITAMTVSGFMPYSFVTFHAVEFGILLDVILLSLALADRIKFLRLQNEATEKRIIEHQLESHALLHQAKDDLERIVSERTAELCKARDEAERLSRIDALTGAYNRRYFNEVATLEFAKVRRHHQPLSMISFDIDLFKLINDNYGHAAGDEVIRAAASVSRNAVREIDFVARIGGEEFAILLPGSTAEQAAATAERLRELVIAEEIHYQGKKLAFTASFGVAQLKDSDPSFEALLQRADEMMYRAKNMGRNRVAA
ncbi:GGDEF domain-containing protein [Herminiimonas sp. KBW02]|uniref:sensor domain-containing diguanylate cyclase n=1 Tax=Herminiimonas sp. KBW02 TaxID=2153363 RepID=UPI000F5AF40B|nr:diguanylate cyclase [Herminiimonas sp. KBW02]RQO36373.1 GGDEF domain-containing protein [Herminiimonas sp. KBW02]